jgi:hypothetical protein
MEIQKGCFWLINQGKSCDRAKYIVKEFITSDGIRFSFEVFWRLLMAIPSHEGIVSLIINRARNAIRPEI